MSLAAIGLGRALSALVVAVVVWVGVSGFVRAQTAAPAARGAGGDGTVEIIVVGAPGDLQRVRAVVDSRSLAGPGARWARLARFDPMEILRRERDISAASLRCWIDVVDPRRARLYFAAHSGQQFLVRDVEMSGTFDEVDREALSQVIELSVSALLENERAGLTRAQTEALLASREAPRPPPATAPPEPPSSPPEPGPSSGGAMPSIAREPPAPPPPVGQGPTAGVFYRAQAQGTDLPVVHGPGVALAWGGLGPRALLGGWASGQYQVPVEEIGRAIGLRLETVAARAGVQAYLALDPGSNGNAASGLRPAGVAARLGVGADVVRVTPRPGSADPSAALTSPRWSSSLVFGAVVAVTWRVGRRTTLGAVAALDLLPTAVHYDLDVGGRTSAAFSPWRARPGLGLELLFR